MSSPPRVSVVVAAHDAERFLRPTLASVLRQTFADFELVVVDDGSRDGTAGLVRGLAAEDARLRLVTQTNRGVSAARNRGVAAARGELVAFLDHDDLWRADKLARQVAKLDATPGAGVATCFSALLDERQRCTGWRVGDRADGDVYRRMLACDLVSGGSVVLARRAALDAAGPFDETLALREDWDLWIRLARRSRFVTVPEVLVGYTRRAGGGSRARERMAAEGQAVLAKARRDDPAFDGFRFRYCAARDLFAMAAFCALDGETGPAWRLLARSLVRSPAPVVASPRRWAFVAQLAAQTVLPAPAYRRLLGAASRRLFDIAAGRPFLDAEPERSDAAAGPGAAASPA